MNIIYLDRDPVNIAKQLSDWFVSRGILETGQMLSTSIKKLGLDRHLVYKPLYKTHPMVKWVGKSYTNLLWTYDLFKSLSREYYYRFNKHHKTYTGLNGILNDAIIDAYTKFKNDLGNINSYNRLYKTLTAPFYAPPQCVPENYKVPRGRGAKLGPDLGEYQSLATIMAYRRYYLHEKSDKGKYTKRTPPEWFINKSYSDILEKMILLEKRNNVGTGTMFRAYISPSGEPEYPRNVFSLPQRFRGDRLRRLRETWVNSHIEVRTLGTNSIDVHMRPNNTYVITGI